MSGPWVFMKPVLTRRSDPFITSLPPVGEVSVSLLLRAFSVPRFVLVIEPVQRSCVARCSAVLKVEVAYPVDDVKQQEGSGEEDARVRVQLQ